MGKLTFCVFCQQTETLTHLMYLYIPLKNPKCLELLPLIFYTVYYWYIFSSLDFPGQLPFIILPPLTRHEPAHETLTSSSHCILSSLVCLLLLFQMKHTI